MCTTMAFFLIFAEEDCNPKSNNLTAYTLFYSQVFVSDNGFQWYLQRKLSKTTGTSCSYWQKQMHYVILQTPNPNSAPTFFFLGFLLLFGSILSLLDDLDQVLVVQVEWVLKVHELKLHIFGLLRLDHDLHLDAMLCNEHCCLLNACVLFQRLGLNKYKNY